MPSSLLRSIATPLALCAIVRALLVLSFLDVVPVGDEAAYLRVGHILVEYRTYTGMWAPLYPAFLAAIESLTSKEGVELANAVRVVQGALSLVTCYTIARLADTMAGRRAARWTAWIFALYVPLAGFAPMVFSETLFVALLVPALELLVRATRIPSGDEPASGPRIAPCLGAGVLLGLCALTRESSALLIAPLALWSAWGARGAALSSRCLTAALIALAGLCTLTPWTLRNAMVNDRFSLIAHSTFASSQVGLNAHDVNFDHAGLGSPSDGIPGDLRQWIRGESSSPMWLGIKTGNWIDRMGINVRRGLRFAADDPVFFARSRVVEFTDTMAPTAFLVRSMRQYELGGPLGFGPARWLVLLLAVASFPILGILALRGASSGHVSLAAVLFAASMAGALVNGMSRYRIPFIPLAIVLAGVALAGAGPKTLWHRRAMLAACAILVIAWIPSLEAVWMGVRAAW